MKKLAIFLLTAALAGVCLAGCGGDAEPEAGGGAGSVSNGASSSVSSTSRKSGVDRQRKATKLEDVRIQGTSGVIVDDGKNYFAIDSMEMTEEGLVIRYRGECDPEIKTNQRGNHIADYTEFLLNGKPLSSVTSRSLKGAEHDFQVNMSEFYIDGKDVVNEIVIKKNTLSELEITELPTLKSTITIGYYENGWGLIRSVEVSFTMIP